MAELIDLSHAIADGTVTYPGLPGPVICDYLSREASTAHYAPGVSFHIGRIDMVANTGMPSPEDVFEPGSEPLIEHQEQVLAGAYSLVVLIGK